MNNQLDQLDHECNELFRKLDTLAACGRDRNSDPEYMQTLYTLRDKTRERLGFACAVDSSYNANGGVK